jgi:3-deoxy-D-arabino-heptulosonate 7-phosphate (DAHP) synthase class II
MSRAHPRERHGCIGGGLTEDDLTLNYSTTRDPRLNQRRAIQMALSLARRLSDAPRAPSTMPLAAYIMR